MKIHNSVLIVLIFSIFISCAGAPSISETDRHDHEGADERREREENSVGKDEQKRTHDTAREPDASEDGEETEKKSEKEHPEDRRKTTERGTGKEFSDQIVKKPTSEAGKEIEEPEKALSYRQVLQSVRGYENDQAQLLFSGTTPYLFRKNIDLQGPSEVLAVFVGGMQDEEKVASENKTSEDETSEKKRPQIEELADISRLYSEEKEVFTCHMKVFYQSGDTLTPLNSYYFGKQRVLESIREVSLNRFGPLPFAVVFTFQTVQGSNEEWVIFYPTGTSRFNIRENLSSHSEVKDIDNDGIQDIIIYEKLFEEGTGYETFVTWYRWNGKSFINYKTINVVRNLNVFLDKVKDLMVRKEYRQFVNYALKHSDVVRLRDQGLSFPAICSKVFVRVQLEEENGEENEEARLEMECMEVRDVVYPEIVEDPFSLTEDDKRHFPLQIRVITQEGSYLYRVVIGMSENPFFNRQFYFTVDP